MGMIAQDKSWLVGFRIVEGALPSTIPLKRSLPKEDISQNKFQWPSPKKEAVFMEPIYYVKKPSCENKTPFYLHNHCPAITWCPNGDLLSIWFSTDDESGREMTILSSRLKAGKTEWEEPSEFFNVPDRNMTGSSLFYDGEGTIFHMNGMFAAVSFDEGKTWPVKKLISDAETRYLDGGGWTGIFEMNSTNAEPMGYLAATQTPDNLIHVVSSNIHYRFNLPWPMKN